MADGFAQLAALRSSCPVSEIGAGLYFVASRDAATAVLEDATRFGGRHGPRLSATRRTLFEEDPVRHGPRRRILSRALNGQRSRRLRKVTRQIGTDVLEPCLRAGRADAVTDIAEPATRQAVGALLGIEPTEQDRIYELVRALRRERLVQTPTASGPAPSAIANEFREWALSEIQAGADGALSKLLDPDRVTGYRLTEHEFISDAQQLCQSGIGATRLLISNVLLRLASDEDLFARVRADPRLVAPLVEESLRYDTPVRLAKRTCTAPAVLGESLILPGDEILISFPSANRDEHHVDRGEEFDLDRRDRHLAFGWGPHRCPGAALARMAAVELTSVVLDRVAALRLYDHYVYDGQPYLDALRFHGPRTLPVKLDAEVIPQPPSGG
jgi:cytochrome P450